jgi:hypothetical protein
MLFFVAPACMYRLSTWIDACFAGIWSSMSFLELACMYKCHLCAHVRAWHCSCVCAFPYVPLSLRESPWTQCEGVLLEAYWQLEVHQAQTLTCTYTESVHASMAHMRIGMHAHTLCRCRREPACILSALLRMREVSEHQLMVFSNTHVGHADKSRST